MAGNSLFIKNKIQDMLDELQIIAYQKNNKLVVSHLNDMPDYLFACYLYNDKKEVIAKSGYQRKHNFVFDFSLLNLQFNKGFFIKYFIKNSSSNERSGKLFRLRDTDFHQDSAPCTDSQKVLKVKLERIMSNTNSQRLGALIIKNELELTPFKGVSIENWDIWETNPFNNRTWQWRLHSFGFIEQLIAYHHLSKNDSILNIGKTAIESWVEQYFDLSDITFEFIWHDHATALRTENLLYFIHYVQSYALDWIGKNSDFLIKINYLIIMMGTKLAKDSFYSKHTNHGLEQVRILLLLSIRFKRDDWLKLAQTRLLSEMKFSFTDEGIHKENSPAYHQFVFKMFLNILDDYQYDFLKEVRKYFDYIAPKALEYITHIIRPDGNLPIIGDTELKPTTDGYRNYFIGTQGYKEFEYSFRQARRGEPPKETIKIYPKSGYVIYRDYWHSKESFAQSVHLIFKAGCLSSYHNQQDENHFVLYAYGEDWFIDSGLYKYANKDPIRLYMRRREAHNVPIISDSNYSNKDFNHRIKNWSLSSNSQDDKYYSFTGKNSVLQTVEHSRELKIAKKQKLGLFRFQLIDIINGLDRKLRSVCFLWHVPIDKNVTVKDNKVIIESKKTNKVLIMTLVKPSEVIVEKGCVDGNIVSCVSNTVGVIQDSWVVKVVYENVNSLKVFNDVFFIENNG